MRNGASSDPNRTGERALGSGTPADDHGRPPMCVGVTPALLPSCREWNGDMCDEQEVRRVTRGIRRIPLLPLQVLRSSLTFSSLMELRG
jgi:hypothetical protein